MQNIIGQLANEKIDIDNLKKQIFRHQVPVACQVSALVEMLKYQKSLMPDHLVKPFLDSVKEYVMKELEQLN